MDDVSAASGLASWLLSLLGVYLVVWSLLGMGALVAVIVIAIKIKHAIARVSKRVEEVSSRVKGIADRAEHISEAAEATARKVAGKIDSATDAVRDATVASAVNVSALVTGVKKGVEALRARKADRAKAEGEPEK